MFPCTKCGLCCRVLAALAGMETRADGSCIHLTEDNECSIYEARPPICRVDAMRPHGVSEEKWYKANAEACNLMQEGAGLGGEWRVRTHPVLPEGETQQAKPNRLPTL